MSFINLLGNVYQAGLTNKGGGQVDYLESRHVPNVFVVCDRRDTAPAWGSILQQQGSTVTLETSTERAIDHRTIEMPDFGVTDFDIPHHDCIEPFGKSLFRMELD